MAPDLDEYRRTSLDSWDRFSVNWEREHDYLWSKTGLLGERLVERLDPQPGDTVLELAAGNGDTGFLAAGRLRWKADLDRLRARDGRGRASRG